METRHLLNNEVIITQSGKGVITLTNLRLRYSNSSNGKTRIISILLEKVSSIDVHSKSNRIYLYFAFAAIAVGFYFGAEGNSNVTLASLGLGVLLTLLYLFSRQHFLRISSEGGAKIQFHTKGLKTEKVLQFMNQLEQAIRERRESLK